MEILLPFVTARIIDEGLEMGSMPAVYRYGALMVVMAFFSLVFGTLAGKFAASASSGLSANLREEIYNTIQTFSFSNIDKFSVPGLVTRMTTDITNVQNAFMMVIRVAVRSPLMLIFSYAMCLIISPRLSAMFLIAVVFLAVVIGTIMVVTLKVFNQVFRKYDDLNASVQENISATVKDGAVLGTATVYLDGYEVGTVDLVTHKEYVSDFRTDMKATVLLLCALVFILAALTAVTLAAGSGSLNLKKRRRRR